MTGPDLDKLRADYDDATSYVPNDLIICSRTASAFIEALEAENERLRAEVRRFQAWVSELTEGDELLCEDLCPVICAGPCSGVPLAHQDQEPTP